MGEKLTKIHQRENPEVKRDRLRRFVEKDGTHRNVGRIMTAVQALVAGVVFGKVVAPREARADFIDDTANLVEVPAPVNTGLASSTKGLGPDNTLYFGRTTPGVGSSLEEVSFQIDQGGRLVLDSDTHEILLPASNVGRGTYFVTSAGNRFEQYPSADLSGRYRTERNGILFFPESPLLLIPKPYKDPMRGGNFISFAKSWQLANDTYSDRDVCVVEEDATDTPLGVADRSRFVCLDEDINAAMDDGDPDTRENEYSLATSARNACMIFDRGRGSRGDRIAGPDTFCFTWNSATNRWENPRRTRFSNDTNSELDPWVYEHRLPLDHQTHPGRTVSEFWFVRTDDDGTMKAKYWHHDYDDDEDEVADRIDNCIDLANPADDFGRQLNSDEDSLGDACDRCPQDSLAGGADDPDNDNVCNRLGNEILGTTGDDNCPEIANTDQLDTDSDRRGDVCDTCPGDRENDRDRDGVCAGRPAGEEQANDNCPMNRNPDQENRDGDAFGDVCDDYPDDPENDVDGDFISGEVDNCPRVANSDQTDSDEDSLGDLCDPCPSDRRVQMPDGEMVEDYPDNDDVCSHEGLESMGMRSHDNCPEVANPRQEDTYGTEQGDACETRPETDAGTPDAGPIDSGMPDATPPQTPDAHTATPDASNNQQQDAGPERTDTDTSVTGPPKDGCADCNQTGKTPEGLMALFGLALTRVFRKRKSNLSMAD